MKERKKTFWYLYNEDPKILEGVDYKKALEMKINLVERLIYDLQCIHYTRRDSQHINDVVNAIKFNRELLRELK